ncbi:MAG: hypothetical protein V1907_04860 [Candidatus Kerfeldbacteria bacterium]
MKRTIVIGFALALFLSVAAAKPAFALPAILPDCDQTEYYLGQNCEPGTGANCTKLTAEQYFNPNGKYGTPELRAANPPVVIKTNKACGFNDFVKLFTNLASYGLGALAVVGLTVIVWGGFGFILAMGNQEKIQESKKTIWGGVLGTFIVLISFIMVNFFVGMLTGTGSTLFSGTEYERQFYGEKCPNYKKSCSKTGITYNATDDKMFGLSPKIGCSDDPKKKAHPVADLQTKLKQVNCYSDVIDGCFGPNSLDALMGFQSKNDIWPRQNVDGSYDTSGYGIADQDTWDKLDQVIATGGSVPAAGRGCAAAFTTTVSIGTVTQMGGQLFPSVVALLPGGTVTWHNYSLGQITVQIDTPLKVGGTKEAPHTFNDGEEYSVTFKEAGIYDYHIINPQPGQPSPKGSIGVTLE